MEDGLHLYVWPGQPQGGMMIALARSEEEARLLLREKAGYLADEYFDDAPEVHDAPMAAFMYGD